MSAAATMGLERLRALLYGPPTPEAWRGLCQTFMSWPEGQPVKVGLDYALAHMARWGSEARMAPRGLTHALLEALDHGRAPAPHPLWALVEGLDLSRSRLHRASAERLAKWPGLARLHTLDLSHNLLNHASAEALAASTRLDRLRVLSLRDNALGDQGVAALAEALPGLHRLELHHTRLGERGLGALLAPPPRPELRHLGLGNNQLDDACAKLLGSWPGLTALAGLDLQMNQLDDAGIASLLGAELPHLERLDLSHNNFGLRGLTALLERGAALPGLRHLHLQGLGLTDAMVDALAAAPLLAQLETLDLDHCRLGDAGLLRLLRSPHLGELRHLHLRSTGVTLRGGEALAASSLSSLETLDLSFNSSLTGGARALLAAPMLGRMRHLHLRNVGLDRRALEGVADSPMWPTIETLDLSHNSLGVQGARALAQAQAQRLRELQLGSTDLTAGGVTALARAPWLKAIEVLGLDATGCRDEGLDALVGAARPMALCSLHLRKNGLSDGGAAALGRAALPRLWMLDLRQNAIGGSGARALLDAPALESLEELDLGFNAIDEQGAATMAASPGLARLDMLRLESNPVGPSGLALLASAPGLRPHLQARLRR